MSFLQNQLEIRGKTAVIIDGGYLRVILKSNNIKYFNYELFSNELSRPSFRLRTYYFDSKSPNEQSIHDELELNERFEVVKGELSKKQVICPSCTHKFSFPIQKGVDVALAGKLIHLATTKQVDKIILIAGDQDFIPAVKTVKETGVIIELVYDTNSVSTNLKKLVDERKMLKKDYLLQFGKEIVKKVEKIDSDDIADASSQELSPQILKMQESINEIFSELQQEEIPISEIGNKLIIVYPTWKEEFKGNMLREVIRNFSNYSIVRQDTQMLVKKLDFQELDLQTQLKLFLKNILDTYFNENELITTNELGLLLYKENNEWRTSYKVKKKKFKEIIAIYLKTYYLFDKEGYIRPNRNI